MWADLSHDHWLLGPQARAGWCMGAPDLERVADDSGGRWVVRSFAVVRPILRRF